MRTLRLLRTLLWLRYRMLINGLRAARGRDAIEQGSRVFGWIVATLVILVSLGAATGLGWAGWSAGRAVGAGSLPAAPLVLAIRIGLLGLLLILVVAPLGRSLHGRDAGSSRLLLVPVSRRLLHAAQLLSGLLDPWVIPVIPLLVLLPAGLAASGRLAAAALVALAGLVFLPTLAATGSLASLAVQAILRRRGRAEIVALLFFGVLSTVGILPSLLQRDIERHAGGSPLRGRAEELARTWPVALRILPSELYARATLDGIEGKLGAGLAGCGALLALGAGLYSLSARIHGRLLASPEGEGTRRRGPGRVSGANRWPGLTPAAAAVASAQVRSILRTLRGKFAVFFTGPLVALIALSLRQAHVPGFWKGLVSHQGFLAFGGTAFIALNAAQPYLANLFAVDKAGLTRQFLTPIRDRDLLLGKLAGAGALHALTLALCLVACLLVLPGGSPVAWAAAYIGGLSAYFLAAPVLALLSIVLPKTADLNKMGNPGNPHPASSLLAVFVAGVAITPPLLVLGIGTQVLHRPWLSLTLALAWAALTGALSWLLAHPLGRALAGRRENLILVAERR